MCIYNRNEAKIVCFFYKLGKSLFYFLWLIYFVSVELYIYRINWNSNRGTLSALKEEQAKGLRRRVLRGPWATDLAFQTLDFLIGKGEP